MRYDQAGGGVALSGEETLPKQPLRLHIECAGQVVENQEPGGSNEHTRGSRPLYLSAGELDPPTPHQRFEALVQVIKISLELSQLDGAIKVDTFLGQS